MLADAETAYPVREDDEFFTISMPLAICRFAAVEAGARLVRADMIALPETSFFLNSDGIADALRSITATMPTVQQNDASAISSELREENVLRQRNHVGADETARARLDRCERRPMASGESNQ